MNQKILDLAKIIWDYLRLNQEIEKSDLIMILGSHDIRVAERWIELIKKWYAKKILFSGWIWRLTDWVKEFMWTTEADIFAKIAIKNWIKKEQIIIENKSTNTWENIIFSYELIKDLDIKSIILVQKPYMERRVFATFSKQWPWKKINFYITSPKILFEDYPNEIIKIEQIINIMIWDLDRIIKYPKLWFQIYQEVPEKVMKAFYKLIDLWFDKDLIK